MFSKNLITFSPFAIAALLPLALAESVEYKVNPWGIPDPYAGGYPTVDAKPGDTVSFHWIDTGYNANYDYNVYLYPTESCVDETGKEWIGSSSGAAYRITEWDQGKKLHFACDTADYCDQGMSITINIAAAAADPWAAPTEPPTKAPTPWPTATETKAPTSSPTPWPTKAPTPWPTEAETEIPVTPAPTEGVINDIVEEPPAPQNVDLQWLIPDPQVAYEPINVNVGDTLTFNMGAGHNVFIHPSQSCDQTDAIFVGDQAATSYTFKPEDGTSEGNPMFFACDVGPHCDLGMQIVVNVFSLPIDATEDTPQPELQPVEGDQNNEAAPEEPEPEPVQADENNEATEAPQEPEPEPVQADQNNEAAEGPKTVSLEWLIPEDQLPFDPISVNVGDSIAFNMQPGHNVFIHPTLSCDQTGAIFVGDEAENIYTFQAEDGSPGGKPMFFACDVGPHCDLGMQIAVNVFSTESSSTTSSSNTGSSDSSGQKRRKARIATNRDQKIMNCSRATSSIKTAKEAANVDTAPNSLYATLREENGKVYLCMKTVERAHSPKNLWEKVLLSRNYAKALTQIDEHLQYFPKALIHRNKQRLTKIHQYLLRMRKLKLKELAGKKAKIVQAPTRKVKQREERREQKALVAAKITQKVEQELVDRLAKGTYGDMYNFEQTSFNKALKQLEDDEEQEMETEDESEEESVTEYVEDLESDEDEESIEEDMEDFEYFGDGKWGKPGENDDDSSDGDDSDGNDSEDDADDDASSDGDDSDCKRMEGVADDDDTSSNSRTSSDADGKKKRKSKKTKKNSKKPARRKGSKVEIEYEEENEAEDIPMQEAGMAW
ncbi:MAG: hypothetical protein SGILL_002379 [Bacillariaceae sp.]